MRGGTDRGSREVEVEIEKLKAENTLPFLQEWQNNLAEQSFTFLQMDNEGSEKTDKCFNVFNIFNFFVGHAILTSFTANHCEN